MSQTLVLGSTTSWIPVMQSTFAHKDILSCVHTHQENVKKIVVNLSPSTINSFYEQQNPNVFFPHIGIFVSDFALGSSLLGK